MIVHVTVTGEPVPKQSFRFARAGGYQPARVKDWQAAVGWAAKQAMRGQPPTDDPVTVAMHFRLGNRRVVDLDNLIKGTGDALQGVVYNNDSQVVMIHAEKLIDKDNPGVTVEVVW